MLCFAFFDKEEAEGIVIVPLWEDKVEAGDLISICKPIEGYHSESSDLWTRGNVFIVYTRGMQVAMGKPFPAEGLGSCNWAGVGGGGLRKAADPLKIGPLLCLGWGGVWPGVR